MRDGSSTRSAYRREIVRLLVPWLRTPSAVLLGADVQVTWSEAVPAKTMSIAGADSPARPERVEADGTMNLFLEHLGPEFVMLPAHGMRVALEANGYRVAGKAFVWPDVSSAPPSRHGVEIRSDGVLANGPGYVQVHFHVAIPVGEAERFEHVSEVSVHLSLDVTGSQSPLTNDVIVPRVELERFVLPGDRTMGTFHWAAEAASE